LSAVAKLKDDPERSPLMVVLGWCLHAFTAMGAVFGLLAIEYASRGRYRGSFVAMAFATFIDSTDGPIARALQVRTLIPAFDGALLDNIVDFLTYVVAPAFVLVTAHLCGSHQIGLFVASLMVLASCYQFCRVDAKTEDHFFLGFPSYWNLVVFYLFCFHLSPVVNTVIVLAFAVMVFVPIKYIYPNRTPKLRSLTLVLGVVWAFVTTIAVAQLPNPNHLLLGISFSFIIYYLIASFALHGSSLLMRERA
jgi:phosphatidylcholine synthase